MSIKISYGEKSQQFDPNDKVSKVTDKLAVREKVSAQAWMVNGQILPQLTQTLTLAQLGLQAGQEVIIERSNANQIQQSQEIQPPINNQPPQGQQVQYQVQQQVPINPFASQQQQPVPKQPVINKIQQPQFPIQNNNIMGSKPQFQEIKIAVPQQKEKSRKPNINIPQEVEKQIYGFLVRIYDQGRFVELTKPNNEFRAVFLEENSSKEESLKVVLSPNEVEKDPQFSLRIGDSKFGGTKVVFLLGGKGIAIQWHSGFSTKCQFWFDE